MEVSTLRNGQQEVTPLVLVTMRFLESLMTENPIHFFELVSLCRDRTHKLFGNTGTLLRSLALVQDGDTVHDSIRNVVLSAVVGDGLEMRLQSPVESAPDADSSTGFGIES